MVRDDPVARRMSHARVAALGERFASRKDLLLADLETLVVHESPSDDAARVSALAAWIVERLGRTGLEVRLVRCEGRGDSVLVRLERAAGPGTLVLGHIDTVWPARTLAEMPFRVDGDVARGPGVFDMKGGVAVLLSVLDAVGAHEVVPAGGLSVFLSSDEEVGSEATREFFVAEAQRRSRVLVLEPSGEGGAVKIARKGIGNVAARFSGMAAHAGLEPEKGASALLELSRFVLFAHSLADAAAGTSVVVTAASSGKKTNAVPEKAEATLDFRIWSTAEAERISAALAGWSPGDSRTSVTFEGGLSRPPMEPGPVSLALYERAAAIASVLGFALPSARVGGASDGNFTAAAGVPTLDGLGPSGGGAHARSEHLVVSDLPRRAALLSGLLEELTL
jgi:glutamate carboxypeptidase